MPTPAPHRLLLAAAALLCLVHPAAARASLFRSLFGNEAVKKGAVYSDAEQQEMVEWLASHGFGDYATKEWIEKFDDEAAYDSIDDLTQIVDEEEYTDLGMDRETAVKIQEAARKTMMEKFVRSVPLPEGAKPGVFDALLVDQLIAAGYDEPNEVEDLDEGEAAGMGIDNAHYKTLTTYAEEFEAREIFRVVLQTYAIEQQIAKGGSNSSPDPNAPPNPFASEAVQAAVVEGLIKSGVRKLEQVLTAKPHAGLTEELLELLKADPRIAQQATKSEL